MAYRRKKNRMSPVGSVVVDRVRQNQIGDTGCEFRVTNFHWTARRSDLHAALCKYEEIEALQIRFNKATDPPKKTAFVTFKRPVNLKALQGAECMGHYLRVKPKKNRPRRSLPEKNSAKISTLAPGQRTETGIAPSASWVELTAPNGDGSAVLVCYGPEQSGLIRQHFEKLQRTDATPWHGGSLGSAIADQLAGASVLVASGLQAGQMFQVIGTPHLVEGLKIGTHALMQTAEGTLGTVVSSATRKIAGSLRFGKASMAPVLAPVLVWQVFHGIAGTSQLRKINRRLDVILRKLETIATRSEAGVLGEVLNAVHTLDDILEERANTGTFTEGMEIRLALVEMTIGSILERNRSLVDLFRIKASEIPRLGGKTGAVRATRLLQEEGGQAVHDMEMLFGLAAADLRVEGARILHAMEHNPADTQRRLDKANAKVGEHRELLENLPSVEGVKSRAQACVEEMSWWERNISARVVRKETAKLTSLKLRDARLPVRSSESLTEGSYVFWKDEADVTKVHMLPNGDDHE